MVLWALLWLGHAVAGDPPIGPELEITERVERHAVDGSTWQQLPESLASLRSAWDHAQLWSGATRTSFLLTTRVQSLPGNAGCVLAGHRLEVEIVRSLPRSESSLAAARPARRQRMLAALAQLERHEEGHRRHALDAASKLHAGLQALPAQADCRRLQFAVDRLRRRVSHAHQLRGQLYDHRSQHGLADAADPDPNRLAKAQDDARRRAQDSLRNVVR